MQNLSHVIRKFNRFELKYLVTLQQAQAFKSQLKDFLTPDDHGSANGRYQLTSLYYDSPDYRCYWEKENGVRVRRKLRIRRYENGEMLTEATPVFVEIKQRIWRVTQKRRAILPYGDALRLCNDRQLPDCAADDQATVDEIYAFIWQYDLYPASIVRYERQAFMGGEYDLGLRITFDTMLTTQTGRLLLHDEPSAMSMLAPQLVVMEIKVNERIPFWLTDLIAAHNLSVTSFSKYCRSLKAAPQLSLAHRRLTAKDWSRNLYSSFPAYFLNREQQEKVEKHWPGETGRK